MWIPVRDDQLFTLCFADDKVVITQNEEVLSYMLRKLKKEYEEVKLEVNLDKM